MFCTGGHGLRAAWALWGSVGRYVGRYGLTRGYMEYPWYFFKIHPDIHPIDIPYIFSYPWKFHCLFNDHPEHFFQKSPATKMPRWSRMKLWWSILSPVTWGSNGNPWLINVMSIHWIWLPYNNHMIFSSIRSLWMNMVIMIFICM